MSGTDLDITLSPTLLTELEQAGVYAYAEVFGSVNNGGTLPAPVTLVNDGTVGGVGGSFAIALTNDTTTELTGGKIYFVVQSLPAGTASTLSGIISTQSNITPENAATYDFGYDSMEVTLDGSASDAANLTSVNGFGLPMTLSTSYDDGTSASVGYAVSGAAIASDIGTITNGAGTSTFSEGPLAGIFSLSTSPTESNLVPADTPSTTGAFPQSAWMPYIAALEDASVASAILITGQFNGGPDAQGIWHNGGYYAYQLQWDATAGVFWLAPTANSQIQGYIELTPADIAENAYSQIGSVSIYASETAATPFATIGVGANDQWGAVLAQFLTGFTGGYYGQTGNALNPQTTGSVDLDANFNWDPSYAFDKNGSSTLDLPAGSQTDDPYSQIFFDNSNSYGSPYSDALMSQYAVGGPLLSVSEPGSAANVGTIGLTIYADGETPTGYTQPVDYAYIAPVSAAAGYAIPEPNQSGANITLSFLSAVANSEGISLDPTATITLAILTGDTDGVPTWSTVTLDAAAAANGLGLWQQWSITASGGGYTAAPLGTTQLSTGSLQILNFPTATSGVSWYQITVGTGTDAKTYNLYTTTGDGGSFENPAYSGQQAALAVDGLASIATTASATPAQYLPTLTVNFVRGDTVTYNPALVVENTGSAGYSTVPTSPVVGTIDSGGTFGALSGQGNEGTAGSLNTITTATSTGLAFGWTGLNPAGETTAAGTGVITGWENGYTNKTNPGDDAVVTIENSLGQTATIATIADLDGAWVTRAETLSLGNGSYTITMQDLPPTTNDGTIVPGAAVTPVSEPLTIDVENGSNALAANDIAIASVPCFRSGTRIATPDGETSVEALRAGDTVLTIDGTAEVILWIGHRQVDCARHPQPELVWPVLILAHAFAHNHPHRDLFLSPDHAVFAEGALIPVKHLVNGRTVRQVALGTVVYCHIELERHAVILAEGLAAETYLDTGDRASFANGGDTTMLHPAWGGAARDVAMVMEAIGYAPLRVAGAEVSRLRARLARRAQRRGAA
jgi:hypothetical protein